MTRPPKRSLHLPWNVLFVLAMAVGSFAGFPRPGWAGPVKDKLAEAAGAALRELGKQAASAQDRKFDQEPDALRDCMLAIYGDPSARPQAPDSSGWN